MIARRLLTSPLNQNNLKYLRSSFQSNLDLISILNLLGASTRTSTSFTFTSRTMSTSISSSSAPRTYSQAIQSLNTLQSNAAIIEQIRLSGGKLNELAMPEFIEYLQVLGYKPEDLNRLNVIHITGTKGKGSTAAFCDGLLSQVRPEDGKVGE